MDPPKTQHRIWKDADLRSLKIDDSFITNEWQIFPWVFLPTNRFQTWDLILFCHYFRRYVEHLVKCEICSIHNGILIVLEILTHECRWFHCDSHDHSPNHGMFLSVFCNIWIYFLSFSYLIIQPILEWSWFYRQFPFCFFVSHDGILRFCYFFRIDINRSPWSITKCFSVPYGLRGSTTIINNNLLNAVPQQATQKSDDDNAWSSQEWNTGTEMYERPGRPDVTSWGATRESQPGFSHEKTQHDGTAQSIVNEVILRDRTGQPVVIPQRGARPQQFVIGNYEAELWLSVESISFLDRVNDQVRKRQRRISNVTENGEKHSMAWWMFMAVTMESAVFMGKNYLDNCHSIVNTKDPTMKQMFDNSTRLMSEQDEISGFETIGWENHSWKYLSLIGDERVINLQHTKVYVFSDSVLWLVDIFETTQSNEAWEDMLGWFKTSPEYRSFDRIDGEPMEFEWNIFPGFNTLQLSEEVKRLLYRLGETPENFSGRILFKSMFNDTTSGTKGRGRMSGKCSTRIFVCKKIWKRTLVESHKIFLVKFSARILINVKWIHDWWQYWQVEYFSIFLWIWLTVTSQSIRSVRHWHCQDCTRNWSRQRESDCLIILWSEQVILSFNLPFNAVRLVRIRGVTSWMDPWLMQRGWEARTDDASAAGIGMRGKCWETWGTGADREYSSFGLWKRSQRWANPWLCGAVSWTSTMRKSTCFRHELVWNKPVDPVLCRLSDVLVRVQFDAHARWFFVISLLFDFSWAQTIHIDSSAISSLKSFLQGCFHHDVVVLKLRCRRPCHRGSKTCA